MLTKTVEDLVAEAKAGIEAVSPDEIAGEVRAGDVAVIDVREQDEWEGCHIQGAIHVPRGWLEFKADPGSPFADPRLDPATRFVVHCAAGKRSALATARLREMGYEHVVNLEGGIEAWEKAGHPVERSVKASA